MARRDDGRINHGRDTPMPDTAAKSWARRMAEDITTDLGGSVERIELALETAGELKAARCKILLGRCLEILSSAAAVSKSSGGVSIVVPQEFLAEIAAAIQ